MYYDLSSKQYLTSNVSQYECVCSNHGTETKLIIYMTMMSSNTLVTKSNDFITLISKSIKYFKFYLQ